MAGYPPATTGPVGEGFQFRRYKSGESIFGNDDSSASASGQAPPLHLCIPSMSHRSTRIHGFVLVYVCMKHIVVHVYKRTHMRLSVCVAAHRVHVPCAVYHTTHRHSRSAMPVNYLPRSRTAKRIYPAPRVSCRRRTAICWTESSGSPTRCGPYMARRSPVRVGRWHARSKQHATAILNFRFSRRCWVRCRHSETVTHSHWMCIL